MQFPLLGSRAWAAGYRRRADDETLASRTLRQGGGKPFSVSAPKLLCVCFFFFVSPPLSKNMNETVTQSQSWPFFFTSNVRSDKARSVLYDSTELQHVRVMTAAQSGYFAHQAFHWLTAALGNWILCQNDSNRRSSQLSRHNSLAPEYLSLPHTQA